MYEEDKTEGKDPWWAWLMVVGIFVLVIGGAIAYGMYTHQNQDTGVEPDPNGYSSCSEAHQYGVYDIPEDSPAYNPKQDADHDGIACEHYLGN